MTLYPRAPAARRRGDGTAKTLEMTHSACELVPRSASALLSVLAAPQRPESSSVPSDPMAPMKAVSSRLQTQADSFIKARDRFFAVGAALLLLKRQIRVRINAADSHQSVWDKRVRESVHPRHRELNVSPGIFGLKNYSKIRQGWDRWPDAARLGVLCVSGWSLCVLMSLGPRGASQSRNFNPGLSFWILGHTYNGE